MNCLPPYVVAVTRSDRWQVHQRLQDLSISCSCTEDGYLWVDVVHPIEVLQVRSVTQQITESRSALIDWLERCWQIKSVQDR